MRLNRSNLGLTDTFQTPSGYISDTFKTPFRHLPDTYQ